MLFDIRRSLAVKKKRTKTLSDRTRLDREFWERYDETTRRLLERIECHKRKIAEERAARGENSA